MKKRLLSAFLSVIMTIMCLPIQALAVEFQQDNEEIGNYTISTGNGGYLKILSLNVNRDTTVNLSDVLILQYDSDNEIMQSVSYNDTATLLLVTDYEKDGSSHSRTISLADRIQKVHTNTRMEVPGMSANSYSTAGYITYNKGMYDTTQHRISLLYETLYSDSESYIINAEKADTLSIVVGILASVLSLLIPATKVITQIAVAIISSWGGSTLGGAIGVIIKEEVAVNATYYNMYGSDYSTNRTTPAYPSVKRQVITKRSSAYQEWFYEGYTPSNWKDNTLAYWCWSDLWATEYPGVKSYS